MRRLLTYFSRGELALWFSSLALILASFFLFDRESYLTLAASIVGVTSLIFCAKGNPIGQALMVIFSVLYGIISYSFAYYGEMITYLGMTAPMALFSLIAWLVHPYKGNRAEVAVNRLRWREIPFLIVLTAAVTVGFYFILDAFGTANIVPSTLSVATSFGAVYLTFRRCPYFALIYAANDLVLIVLWALAARTDISYLSVIICFAVFLVNDLYGFISWQRMARRQTETKI
ncbi:MAG: nicotinamide mononucleotide transporter [Clostridia bacterium]|nr:nicotinamide mononucleotide transporter [Clostridia bacterium]